MAIESHSSSSKRTVCCRILGLEPSATHEEIRSAYKHLALKWHPDRQKSQKEHAKDRFVEIHEAYQTLMDLPPMPPPVSRDTSGFTSPPSTPASKPSHFYSQTTGSASSWASSGSSSNASTPRTSTDELPTPKPGKHARTHSKTSTDGFRRARTRTLSRVKKSDKAQFTRTDSSNSGRSHGSSKSHHSSSRHHHSSRSHKSDRSDPPSKDRSHSSKDKGKEKHSSSKHSHSHSERSEDRSDRSDRDDHRRHRSHRHHSRSRSRSRSRDRSERHEHSRHSGRGKERERGKDKGAKVEEPEVKREKVEKKPAKEHRKPEKENESPPREKTEKVEEEINEPPPQASEPSPRPPIIGIPLRPSRAPDTNNSDWIFPLPLTLEELFTGTNYRFQITRQLRNSPTPDSAPTSTPKSMHASLDGEASTSTIHVNVDIPPGGYKNMTQMRFEGIGNQRKSDGTFQDIVFVVQEVLHDRFIRIQDDLVARIELTWDEALQKEDVILVDGLDGEKVEVPIPRVPDDNKEIRIPKAGMPVRNSKDEVVGRGDLVIRWEFVFPQKQSSSKWQALKSKFSWQQPKATAP